METTIILLILVLGLLVGYLVGYLWGAECIRRKRMVRDLTLPDYDMDNPINQGQHARTVVEDGVKWTVYGGWGNGQRQH